MRRRIFIDGGFGVVGHGEENCLGFSDAVAAAVAVSRSALSMVTGRFRRHRPFHVRQSSITMPRLFLMFLIQNLGMCILLA